jgi:Short C-terminal domain
VPFMRRRPLLRTAVVGGGAYLAGKHMATKQQAGQDPQDAAQGQRPNSPDQQQATVPAPRAAPAPPMSDQLNQLASLHKQGVLSDDEFAVAKAKLLGG